MVVRGDYMAIGNKIVTLRKKYNFTQEVLAEKVGVSRQTLSSWESDITSPDFNQASVLAKVLKISLDELADNNLEIDCKDNSKNQIYNNLIGKTCFLTLSDELLDLDINFTTPVKVLNVNDDFIKIENLKNKKKTTKLIDIDLIISIKVIEGDDK
jgi:transcriptional regulator with XRE-family HTH domain